MNRQQTPSLLVTCNIVCTPLRIREMGRLDIFKNYARTKTLCMQNIFKEGITHVGGVTFFLGECLCFATIIARINYHIATRTF